MPRVWLQRGCIIGGSSSSCMGEAGALAGVLAARLHRDWRRRGPRPGPFACANCCGVLQRPVTAACGHTCCRACVRARCPECGVRAHHQQHNATNVLVQGLVERLWRDQLSAARRAHDAERLLACRADPDKALANCNDALHYFPNNHQLLAVRCQVLNSQSRYSEALKDADAVIEQKPTWSKGHFVRGIILFNLNLPKEALISFCISASLGHSTQLVKKHITLCLSRLLTTPKWRQKSRKRTKVYSARIHRSHSLLTFDKSRLCMHQSATKFSKPNDLINLAIEKDKDVDKSDMPEIHKIVNEIFMEVKEYSDMPSTTTDLQLDNVSVDQADFECILCCRTLWRPVTTPCGHTYCLHCLERCLDYSSTCPLCMNSLADSIANDHKSVTTFIEEAMRIFIPSEYIARKISHKQEIIGVSDCEPHIPVFVCTTAFPTVSCPLFIFEPRYRLMIRRCLESGLKQFGIAACSDNNSSGPNRYVEVGTVLEIKDCVLMGDGCSILSTVGVKRFRVRSRGERDGYDIAQIETIQDTSIEVHSLEAVTKLHNKVRIKAWLWFRDMPSNYQNKIVQTFGVMPEEEEDWKSLKDGPSWTWWVVAILPLKTSLKVMLLETPDLEKRLRTIDRTLDIIYFLGKKQTIMNDRALAYTDPPPDFYNSPWIFNQSASTSQLGEQSM